jgi:Zn-dependent protease with chaperone function
MSLALLALSLLVPVALVAVLRRAALRTVERSPDAAWFGFWRATHLLSLLPWLGWGTLLWSSGEGTRLAALLRPLGPPATTLLLCLAAMAPPALAGLAIVALSHAVVWRARGIELSLRETVEPAAWQMTGLVLALSLLAVGYTQLAHLEPRGAAACVLAALLAFGVFVTRGRDRSGLAPHAVSSGELRDRVFALASAAGQRLRMLYVVPAARMRLANAFAVRGNVVVLTDHLLAHLSRREIDAVLAHELTHLRLRHPFWLMLLPTTLWTWALLFGWMLPGWLLWPLVLFASLVVYTALPRRFEARADVGAVAMTHDPAALISALARINRLNRVPLDWGNWTGALLTHPSTLRRARAIARAAGLPAAAVDPLLAEGCGDETRYEVPHGIADGGKAYSTPYKARWTTRIGLGLVATLAFLPAALLAVARLALPDAPRALLLTAALVVTALAALALSDVLGARPAAALRGKLAARNAVASDDRSTAWFVGLAPGEQARVFEGSGDWDLGFLRLDGERLCFLGEETRFALRRDEVTDVQLGAALPGWGMPPRVVVRWRGGAFSLRAADVPRVSAGAGAARRLRERLAAWHAGTYAAPSAARDLASATLPPPEQRAVTSLSPAEAAHPRSLLPILVLLLLASLMASGLCGLPLDPERGAGFLDALTAGVAVLLLLRLPWWLHRDRPASSEPARERRAA